VLAELLDAKKVVVKVVLLATPLVATMADKKVEKMAVMLDGFLVGMKAA